MNCYVFIDEFLEALRDNTHVVLLLSGGAKVVVQAQPGMHFTLPHDSGIVNPFKPEGTDCVFETRTEDHNDRDLICIYGPVSIHTASPIADEIDREAVYVDPSHITAIYKWDLASASF